MKEILIDHMDIDAMDDELMDVWAVDMFMGGEDGYEWMQWT